jgi:hypothetical protein
MRTGICSGIGSSQVLRVRLTGVTESLSKADLIGLAALARRPSGRRGVLRLGIGLYLRRTKFSTGITMNAYLSWKCPIYPYICLRLLMFAYVLLVFDAVCLYLLTFSYITIRYVAFAYTHITCLNKQLI